LRQVPAEADRQLWGELVPFRAEAPRPLDNLGGYEREFLILIGWSLLAAGLAAGAAFWDARQENA